MDAVKLMTDKVTENGKHSRASLSITESECKDTRWDAIR